MPSLPSQIDFQQNNAKPVAAGDLEVMGKRASASWARGDFRTLGESVVESVKEAGLSPEQVRRVVEFANTDAFLEAFHKLGSGHRYVDFGHGILADPREVLRDLNDGGGGSVFDRGSNDYSREPESVKTSHACSEAEVALHAAFTKEAGEDIPFENPSGWVWEVREKLAGATQHLTSTLSGLEVAYADVSGNLYDQVKQAARAGVNLGEMIRAWSSVVEDPTYVKVAFQLMTPRMLREQVFADLDSINQSIDKTGSARVVNPSHPLVTGFGDYCEVLGKLAEVRQQRDREANKLAQINHAIKRFGADMDKVASVVKKVLDTANQLGEQVAKGGQGGALRQLAGFGIKASPYVATAGALKGGADYLASSTPVMAANSVVNPYSDVYQQRMQMRDMMARQKLGLM